jgi:nicotinamide-nucleotide amidase
MISKFITSIANSSKMFKGSWIVYTNESKMEWLNIPLQIFQGKNAPGAISKEAAILMAEHSLQNASTDFSISITGVAGPNESEGKQVGLVFIAVASKFFETSCFEFKTTGSRELIQLRAAKHSLYRLWQYFKNIEKIK